MIVTRVCYNFQQNFKKRTELLYSGLQRFNNFFFRKCRALLTQLLKRNKSKLRVSFTRIIFAGNRVFKDSNRTPYV